MIERNIALHKALLVNIFNFCLATFFNNIVQVHPIAHVNSDPRVPSQLVTHSQFVRDQFLIRLRRLQTYSPENAQLTECPGLGVHEILW